MEDVVRAFFGGFTFHAFNEAFQLVRFGGFARLDFVGGFVFKVELIDLDGGVHVVWEGTDTTPCPGQFAPTWEQTAYSVVGVRVHTQVDDWEEIDAVELVGLRFLPVPDDLGLRGRIKEEAADE